MERTITILGIDEADSARGQVSWISPIARALLKAREGEVVKLVTPAGAQEVEVVKVEYPAREDRTVIPAKAGIQGRHPREGGDPGR